MKTSHLEKYQYTECGLDNVFLANGYSLQLIDGEEYLSIQNIDKLHDAIAYSIANKNAPLTGKEFRFLRETLNLSRKNLSSMIGCDQQTVGRWEKSESVLPRCEDAIIRQIFIEERSGLTSLSYRLKFLAEQEAFEASKDIVLSTSNDIWSEISTHS